MTYKDQITNITVSSRIYKALYLVKKKTLQYFEHIMRYAKYGLLQLMIQLNTKSRKAKGRPKENIGTKKSTMLI